MSRGLLRVLAVLFLAASVWAGGPDDLFDARVQGALQPGQKETILALDGGRYTLKDGRYFVDARPSDPAKPLLTVAQVAALLAPSGSTRLPTLPLATIGAGPVYQDTTVVKHPQAVQPNFDGGSNRGGDVRGPPGSGTGTGKGDGQTDSAVLQAQFLQRLKFIGGKKEKEAITEAVESILKTKTGRALAEQFVKEGATAEVTMAAIGDGKAIEEKGKKVLSGIAGTTDPSEKPPKITLSIAYFDTDADFRRVAMAGTLAHELFGHAFERQRADKVGFSSEVLHHYRGDELGSRLVDWMVQTELEGKVVDADPSGYLEDPEGYYRGLLTVSPYYAITLSPKEMKNPVTTLRARRAMIVSETKGNAADLKDMQGWAPIIAHFVSAHKIAKTRFKTVEKSIEAFLDYEKDRAKTLGEIKDILDNHIAYWTSPEGAKDKALLIASADDPYMKGREEAAAARAKELRKLRASLAKGRDPASAESIELPGMVITVSGGAESVIDLTELARMAANDKKKNPGHWKK